MKAYHLALVAALLVGAMATAPIAGAHTDLNVTVCDPFEGFCGCLNVLTVETSRHVHTYCMFLA